MLNVTAFAEARAAEIHDLVHQIKNECVERVPASHVHLRKTGLRIFQMVPRHLRRRAASHNIRRLPVRLRKAAEREREQDKSNNSLIKEIEPRRKRRRAGTIADNFAARQKHGRWLETHVWHAKRMRMVDRWGYKLADRPNDKSVRACRTAMAHTVLAHDASYTGVLELCGTVSDITAVLTLLADPTGTRTGAQRYLAGTRYGVASLHWPDRFPRGLICPEVTFLWRPPSPDSDQRTLWMWVHPSAEAELEAAISAALAATGVAAVCTSRSGELNRFIVTGPRAHALLQAILDVEAPATGANIWSALAPLRTPSSLPEDVVLGISAIDPRLGFPRKLGVRPTEMRDTESLALEELLTRWPADAAQSQLWDEAVREAVQANKTGEASLQKRRREQATPRTPLAPTAEDVRLPLLLLRRRPMRRLRASFTGADGVAVQAIEDLGGGWDVIVPAGWGNDIWKALVFGGARTGGQREARWLRLECGVPSVPHDVPTTAAYRAHALLRGDQLARAHFGRPPAKRPPLAKLKLPFSAFDPDVQALVRQGAPGTAVQWTPTDPRLARADADDGEPSPAKRPRWAPRTEPPTPTATQEGDSAWWLHGDVPLQAAFELHADMLDAGAQTAAWKAAVRRLVLQRVPAASDQTTFAWLAAPSLSLADAVVLVELTMTHRGTPELFALVYAPTPDQLAAVVPKGSRRRQREHVIDRAAVAAPVRPKPLGLKPSRLPSPDQVIGFVTTGGHSTTRGCGYAVAVCSFRGLWALGAFQRRDLAQPTVLVRNTTDLVLSPARLRILPA